MLRSILLLATLSAFASMSQAGDTLLALDRDGGRLHLIDVDSFELRQTLDVGQAPHEVLAMPGGRAYVALYGDQQNVGHMLVEIDIAQGKVARRIDTSPLLRPHGLVRAGDNLYFTAELNRAVGRFNPQSGLVDRVLGIGRDISHMIEIAPDGQQLFTADMLSGSVSRIDFRVQQPTPALTHYSIGDKPEGLAITPDGRELWVGLNGEGKLKVLDLASGSIVAELAAGSQPARVKITPDGKYALCIDPQQSQLLVFDIANRKLAHTHRIAGIPLGMVPTADSRRVYSTLVEAGALAEIEIETGKVLRRVELGAVSDGMALAAATNAASDNH
jgi:DNA-binding beta-propeller fold protein YncE